MSVLISVISRIFKHRKDVPVEQEQKSQDQNTKMAEPSSEMSLNNKNNNDRKKTLEDAPAPGEECAP
jgi:hypothetical protein